MSDPPGARTHDSNTSRIRGSPLEPPWRRLLYPRYKGRSKLQEHVQAVLILATTLKKLQK